MVFHLPFFAQKSPFNSIFEFPSSGGPYMLIREDLMVFTLILHPWGFRMDPVRKIGVRFVDIAKLITWIAVSA